MDIKTDKKDIIMCKNGLSDNETKNALLRLSSKNGDTTESINRRIDIDLNTFKRLQAMMPIYLDEIDSSTQKKKNEQISQMVCKAINFMFENDFKQKLEEL